MPKVMPKVECDICHQMFSGVQGVKVHKRWAHSPSGRRKMVAAARRNSKLRINSVTGTDRNGDTNFEADVEKPVQNRKEAARVAKYRKTRRLAERRRQAERLQQTMAGPVVQQREMPQEEIRYCPRCGFHNLSAVRLAMNYGPRA